MPFPLIARALMHDSTARQQETDHKVMGLVSDPCKVVVFRQYLRDRTSSGESPSSIVALLQDNKAVDALTYTSRGGIAQLDAPLSWEYTQHDKVSLHMRGNFGSSSTAGRFQNLGASLLLQLAETNKNISQSVLRSSTGRPLEAGELAAAQAKFHSGIADNSISLTLNTASGKTSKGLQYWSRIGCDPINRRANQSFSA